MAFSVDFRVEPGAPHQRVDLNLSRGPATGLPGTLRAGRQLFALTNDMPDPEPHPHVGEYLPPLRPIVPARRRALAVDAATYAVISAVLVAVWAVTGGGYFWPMWLIIVWGVLLAVHAVSVFRRPGGGSDGA